jgi:hypothetical protein
MLAGVKNELHCSGRPGCPRRSERATSITEAIVGAFVLVPIALCLVDLGVLVVANSINDTAAKNGARAAANQADGHDAFFAAQDAVNAFHTSPILKSITLLTVDYPPDQSSVSVKTQVVVKLPIPFPGLDNLTFQAQDVEPIVSFSPPQ